MNGYVSGYVRCGVCEIRHAVDFPVSHNGISTEVSVPQGWREIRSSKVLVCNKPECQEATKDQP